MLAITTLGKPLGLQSRPERRHESALVKYEAEKCSNPKEKGKRFARGGGEGRHGDLNRNNQATGKRK